MPGILNYTTEIQVDKTVGEIGEMLRVHGAKAVMMQYASDGNPTGVQFLVHTRWGDRAFSLPANVQGVYAVLCRQASAGKIPRRYATMEQANRVAWRIVREWLASQLAMIEAELVTLEQVMLPYVVVRQDKTLYQVLDEGHLTLPDANVGRLMLPEGAE